jgi:hypothetical protein
MSPQRGKKKIPTMRQCHRDMDRAADKMSRTLEYKLLLATFKASKNNPEMLVRSFSAMGSWGTFIDHPDGSDCRTACPPVFTAFSDALQAWGWAVIPAPVRFTAIGAKTPKDVKKETDW